MVFALEACSWREPFRSKAPWCALPPHALAGDDKYSGARRVGAAAKESAGGDDQDEQGKDCNQINLSGVVTSVADFPAHCF